MKLSSGDIIAMMLFAGVLIGWVIVSIRFCVGFVHGLDEGRERLANRVGFSPPFGDNDAGSNPPDEDH